jgi:riboflavin transporter FmnP
MNKSTFTTQKLAKLAIMTAISMVLLLLVRIPFPPAPFLVYDPADVPIYITAFAYGPAAGLIVTLVVCLIQAFLLGGDGLYGFLMHFVATGVVALLIEKFIKEWKRKPTVMEVYGQLIKNTIDLDLDKRIQGNGLIFLK